MKNLIKNLTFRRIAFLSNAALLLSITTNLNFAQQPSPQPAPPTTQKTTAQPPPSVAAIDPFALVPAANPTDVASIDVIVKSLYNVISGDAGVKRDWNRFRSLFYPNAKLIPTGKNKAGVASGRFITAEQYIETSGPYLEKEGFHEIEISNRIEQFGNIAHVFTTYEAKHKLSDAKPFMRGINSIQLLNDGSRWWVINIAWSQETLEFPLPEKYLKK